MSGEFDTRDPRYTALYIGYVVDRADPEQLGRVRLVVPGLLEPASAWAFPLGTVGGGSDRRGFFAVPELGAECGVLFHQGDPDHPYYLSGHWGKPGGAVEVPAAARGLSPEAAPQVRSFETARFALTFDDRDRHEALTIQDKLSGDRIELDGAAMGITIKATSAIVMRADGLVSIEATTLLLNGRPVLPGAKAI